MAELKPRLLKLKIGATEYTAAVSKAKITSKPAPWSSFADNAGGGRRVYALEFDAVQDTATATLWDLIWSSAGTSVAAVYNPSGVATFTAATPGYSGNLTIVDPDGDLLGGETKPSPNERWTVSCVWEYDAKPTKLTTGTF